jgi:hypothetical protein
MAAQLTIQVRLYPHQSKRQGLFPQFSWHTPAGIRVRLTGKKGKKGKKGKSIELVTGPGGVATAPVPGRKYKMSLPELPGFSVRPSRIAVKGNEKTAELTAFPKQDNWLVPLLLQPGPDAQAAAATGVPGAKVRLRSLNGGRKARFTSLNDGSVYAAWPAGDVSVTPARIANIMPARPDFIVRSGRPQERIAVEYRLRPARIFVRPEVEPFGRRNALPGATFEVSRPGQDVPLRQVTQGSQACVFSDLPPGPATVRIIPPAEHAGSPIVLMNGKNEIPLDLAAGDSPNLSRHFRFRYETGGLRGYVVDSAGQPVSGVTVVARCNGLVKAARSDGKGRYVMQNLRVGTWTVMLDQASVRVGDRTLTTDQPPVTVLVDPGETARAESLSLEPDEHGIRGQVTDDSGDPVPNAIVQIRDQQMKTIDTVVADGQGYYEWKSRSAGTFVVNLLRQDGETVQRQAVTINSWQTVNLISRDSMRLRALDSPASPAPAASLPGPTPPDAALSPGMPATAGSGTASPSSHLPREAITDLAAYPVLTEEITTTGGPAPSPGGGGPGTGYGQAVEQVIRDVLGWRPSGDVAGFQAALTGAFQLEEVEGHTEWSWQQRGYAVQADMGALTGAQASIYARAKSALDQMLPLLASITTLNPSLYPPQDLEAIRTVVTAELNELVSELALEGGPRIQRVDELFQLLLGDKVGSRNLNPDLVQGQLGTLRDRFGLTADEIDTVEEERIVTNFRIVVEQALSLQASWSTDRELLSGVNPRTSLGTILIWLSRGLEAVCESVGDLMFALDSVYVDAAQRQVIELNFAGQAVSVPVIPLHNNDTTQVTFPGHEPPLLLSDLLDWIMRAGRDEGPRIIQDAGKDGVLAFAPVLDKLRTLVHATRYIVRIQQGLPPGMRTPRVKRALDVVADQLDQVTNLARLVRRDVAPLLTAATAVPDLGSMSGDGSSTAGPKRIKVTLTGGNLRQGASVVLIPENREDLADLTARHANVTSSTSASAHFRNPLTVANSTGVTWLAVLTNDDGAESNPVAVQLDLGA